MPETRLDSAKQELVGALERLAGGNQEAKAIVDGVEDDLTSILTLMARLTPDHLRLVDIQDVFAHLLDHVIIECWEPARKDQDLAEALDDYIEMLASRLEAKLPVGARQSEKLKHVFASYWEDVGGGEEEEEGEIGGEQEPDEDRSAGYAGDSGGGEPDERRPVRRPAARSPVRFPRSASVTGDIEIGEE